MAYLNHLPRRGLNLTRQRTIDTRQLLTRHARLLALPALLFSCAAIFAQTPPVPGSAPPGTGQSAPEQPEANPGRPTVATPATLTPVGYLQFESGVIVATHSGEFSSRASFNEVIKLSVTPRLQALVSSEPLVHSTAAGRTANHTADLFFGAQGVLSRGEGARPTVSASYFHHIYGGAAPDFDIGTPSDALMLLASADVKGFHYDFNVMFNKVNDLPVRRAQFGQALAVSHGLGRFTISGEVWHFTQPFLHARAVGTLWAVAYAVRKDLVVDAAFNRGLTGTSTRSEVFVGFTYLLPTKLWR